MEHKFKNSFNKKEKIVKKSGNNRFKMNLIALYLFLMKIQKKLFKKKL